MDKDHVFKSSDFYMAENDVLHLIFIDETGSTPVIALYGVSGDTEVTDDDQEAITGMPLLDYDGNTYTTVIIGDQEWTVGNLKVEHYSDGSEITYIPTLDDWFVPSKDELNYMYVNLHSEGLGDFTGNFYWSSSEYNSGEAWLQPFDTGVALYGSKQGTQRVRPCRTFISSTVYALGDTGIGGLIFHIVDNGDGTYTYYEAYPTDLTGEVYADANTTTGATGTAVGTGVTNTAAIVADVGVSSSAADTVSVITESDTWVADTSGAYCYYDNDEATYKTDYGALYNWYAVSNALLPYFTRGGIQEAGWRLPTRDDVETLIRTLGGDPLSGDTVAGAKIKEAGTTHWTAPNTGSTNSSGFTAVGGGERNGIDGLYEVFNDEGSIWTVSESTTAGNAWSISLDYDSTGVAIGDTLKTEGLAVRCIRDL